MQLRRVSGFYEVPTLENSRLTIDAAGEAQLGALHEDMQRHPDWHLEIGLHMDPASRAATPR